MKILVSACLLGVCCRYDGQAKPHEGVLSLLGRHTLIPVCPEIYGGLATPRPAAERVGKRVLTAQGGDVTAQYRRGAEETLRLGRLYGCEAALLKERSPSCGSGVIHNGRFDGGLTPGDGVTAALLRANGIAVYGESEWQKLL
ncbi:MAG: DUF523 domain-containing protein [Angelakisella sp.]|nr:DUF523 domain-containing protein [Angelakisella sp.]